MTLSLKAHDPGGGRACFRLRCATLIPSAFRPQSCHLASDRQFPDVVGVVISDDETTPKEGVRAGTVGHRREEIAGRIPDEPDDRFQIGVELLERPPPLGRRRSSALPRPVALRKGGLLVRRAGHVVEHVLLRQAYVLDQMPKAVGNPGQTRIDRRRGERFGRLSQRHVVVPTLEGRHQLTPDLLVGLGLIHGHSRTLLSTTLAPRTSTLRPVLGLPEAAHEVWEARVAEHLAYGLRLAEVEPVVIRRAVQLRARRLAGGLALPAAGERG